MERGGKMSNLGNKKTMAENLSFYVSKSGKTQKEISEDLGISRTILNEWINGRKYPRIDKIEMMANYFGILKSDLIEDKAFRERPDDMAILAAQIMRDAELLEMIIKYRKLSEKNKIAIIQMIDNLSE